MAKTQLPFANRHEAGRQLGAALEAMQLPRPVVLALPRGGVPVGYEVAQAMRAALGVVLVRKLSAPWSAEYAIGAVAEVRARHRILDPRIAQRFALDESHITWQVERLFAEIARRRDLYAGPDGTLAPPLAGRTAIVVDDGIATGNTMRAALAAVAEERPARLLFAAPVGAADTVASLQNQAQGVCLYTPSDFRAVSLYYADFNQTTDEEVVTLLARAREELAVNHEENSMKRISDVMTREVAVIGPNDTLQQAARLMNEWNVGSLPVCEGRRLVGMITDRDITIRATAEGRSPGQVRVADVMSEGVSYCFEDQRVGEVLQQMGDEQIRRLPVLDRNMQLCGLVAVGDLATRDNVDMDKTLDRISLPSEPNRPSADERRP